MKPLIEIQKISALKRNNKTIIFTSHSLNMISKICDRALILHKGKLIGIGETQSMIEKYKEISNTQKKN